MTVQERSSEAKPAPGGTNVKIEFEDGIAWVILNRPEKRNAMSPTLNREMMDVLDALEVDDRCEMLVLTGAGEVFFGRHGHQGVFPRGRQGDAGRRDARARASMGWQWRRLMFFPKPTIAMVNGWCFGGAFTPLVSCDWRSPPRTPSSGSPRSTGASSRPAT